MKDDIDKYTQVKWYKMNDVLWLSEQIKENANQHVGETGHILQWTCLVKKTFS